MEHDERVDVIDFLPSKGLMATADADGLIKIWNARKELIREVKFNEPISSVTFMNVKGDLLVGHQGQLSKIAMESYNCGKRFLISKEEIK
jgi:WD40 repeat protein